MKSYYNNSMNSGNDNNVVVDSKKNIYDGSSATQDIKVQIDMKAYQRYSEEDNYIEDNYNDSRVKGYKEDNYQEDNYQEDDYDNYQEDDYDSDEYNFERYKESNLDEDIEGDSSVSRPAIIALVGILCTIIISIVVIIVVQTVNEKSKAGDVKNQNVSSQKNVDGNDNNYGISSDESIEDVTATEVAIETQEPTVEPTEEVVDKTEEIKEGLEKLARTDAKANTLLNGMSSYPERLLEDVIRNPEMMDFAVNYLDKINGTYNEYIDISGDVYNNNYGMPLFIQWDARWGYYPYSSACIGISGCGPTSLAMVYVHLTSDISMNPLKMAKFSVDNGHVTVGVGTSWSLMTTGASSFGLQSEKITVSEQMMIQHLQQGHPIIASMGPGIFTDNGHFIVFRKYENGKFYVNDPFCIEHTNKEWSYSQFGSQIKSLWAYWR